MNANGSRDNQRALVALTLLLVTVGFTALLELVDGLARFERASLDLQYNAHGDDRLDPRILIVAVDQRSIDYFDEQGVPFPWPRSLYNPIIEYLTAKGVKAILFDVLFNNSTPFGPEVDEEFADAIRQSGQVVLATSVSSQVSETGPQHPPGALRASGQSPEALIRRSLSLPVEPILSAVRSVAFVSEKPDPDGIYRRVAPLVEYHGQAIPSLGVAALATPGSQVHWPDDEGTMRIGEYRFPVDAQGEVLLNFHSREPFRRISALDVIHSAVREESGEEPPLDPAVFRNAYVFVAYTAPGLFDLKPTPIKDVTPGVEVHATLLANTLDQDFHQRVPGWLEWLTAILGTVIIILSILWLQRIWLTIILITLLIGGLLGVTQMSFAAGWWWSLPQLLVMLVMSMLLAAGYRYHFEDRQRRLVQSAFKHYLSPAVVEQVLHDPSALELGGQKREITLLFSDLAGFTTLSEELDPQELVGVLNGYTSLMSDTIREHDGTVDKFIGDAVMAFWGAPVDQPRQAELAVRATLLCLERFYAFAHERFPDVALGVRIGLDRGDCIVGNMGSSDRFDYTAIGDTVNQAARLEGLNKVYGSRMLMGEKVWTTLNGQFLGREIDYLKVKGKHLATHVYEVIAPIESASDAQRNLCEAYSEAFAAYQRRDWDVAEARLDQLLAEQEDAPARALRDRIRRFRQEPPDTDWDGSFAHLSK